MLIFYKPLKILVNIFVWFLFFLFFKQTFFTCSVVADLGIPSISYKFSVTVSSMFIIKKRKKKKKKRKRKKKKGFPINTIKC